MKKGKIFAIIIDLIVMALMLNIVNNATIDTLPNVFIFVTRIIVCYSTIIILGALLANTSLKKIVWKVILNLILIIIISLIIIFKPLWLEFIDYDFTEMLILTISYLANYLVDNISNKKEC